MPVLDIRLAAARQPCGERLHHPRRLLVVVKRGEIRVCHVIETPLASIASARAVWRSAAWSCDSASTVAPRARASSARAAASAASSRETRARELGASFMQ